MSEDDGTDRLVTDLLTADDLRRHEAERQQTNRLASSQTTGGTLAGAFPAEHLEELRDEWPAVQDAAQVVAERSAELNRRLSEE